MKSRIYLLSFGLAIAALTSVAQKLDAHYDVRVVDDAPTISAHAENVYVINHADLIAPLINVYRLKAGMISLKVATMAEPLGLIRPGWRVYKNISLPTPPVKEKIYLLHCSIRQC